MFYRCPQRVHPPSAPTRRAATLLGVVFLGAAALAQSAPATSPILPLDAIRVNGDSAQIVLTRPASDIHSAEATVVLGSFESGSFTSIPLVRFRSDSGGFVLEREAEPQLFAAGASPTLRAWLVPDRAVADVRTRWPAGARFIAHVESVGPGPAAAWIDVGAWDGVASGDVFLKSIGGQPVLRLDVRSVLEGLAHCRVTRLAKGAQLATGDVIEAWPPPGDRREGRCAATVCFTEPADDAQIVWIARPPRVSVPRETRMELFRNERYVGYASVERQDALFWYARTLPSATVDTIQVGDRAEIRTSADRAAGRISARVFGHNEHGALITAGESDGLNAGQIATAVRGERSLGIVEVLRVTGGYATIRMQAGATQPATAEARDTLERLDEIRFSPPPFPDRIVGQISAVGGDAVAIELLSATGPARGDVLSIRSGDRIVGVVLILDADGRRAAGYVPPASGNESIRAGALVVEQTR